MKRRPSQTISVPLTCSILRSSRCKPPRRPIASGAAVLFTQYGLAVYPFFQLPERHRVQVAAQQVVPLAILGDEFLLQQYIAYVAPGFTVQATDNLVLAIEQINLAYGAARVLLLPEHVQHIQRLEDSGAVRLFMALIRRQAVYQNPAHQHDVPRHVNPQQEQRHSGEGAVDEGDTGTHHQLRDLPQISARSGGQQLKAACSGCIGSGGDSSIP